MIKYLVAGKIVQVVLDLKKMIESKGNEKDSVGKLITPLSISFISAADYEGFSAARKSAHNDNNNDRGWVLLGSSWRARSRPGPCNCIW